MTRRHGVGLVVAIVALAFSIWPLYPLVGGVEPRVFGMPFSMFWLAVLVAAVFSTFGWIFRADRDEDATLDEEYRK